MDSKPSKDALRLRAYRLNKARAEKRKNRNDLILWHVKMLEKNRQRINDHASSWFNRTAGERYASKREMFKLKREIHHDRAWLKSHRVSFAQIARLQGQ